MRVLPPALLALIFVLFTWRGLGRFYTGDDLMNTSWALYENPWRLVRSLIEVWLPVYRPLGAVIYRLCYDAFGFRPWPLYLLCWLLLGVNAILAYRLFREVTAKRMAALIALSLTLVHGSFHYLYNNAGTLYDRLWFLFTVTGLIVYARARGRGPLTLRDALLLTAILILALDSKESAVTLPALFACYELIFVRTTVSLRDRIRNLLPLYLVQTALCVLFVEFRMKRLPQLAIANYKPTYRVSAWLSGMAQYLGMLTYDQLKFSASGAGILLVMMALAALLLRNRVMLFGWLFFVIAMTPMAVVLARSGYVLYLPEIGLGLFFAALLAYIANAVSLDRREAAWLTLFALVTCAVTWIHARHRPEFPDSRLSPQYVLATQFRHDYPQMPRGANLLFASDGFVPGGYDLQFTLQMMYHDKAMIVWRMHGQPEQAPPNIPIRYARVFSYVDYARRYEELDNRDPAESVQLHILKGYPVGPEMDVSRPDRSAYLVSGLQDFDGPQPGRWTDPHARFKFHLDPGRAIFWAKFSVPDSIAKPAKSVLSVRVNGQILGSLPLSQEGAQEVRFPVRADQITRDGFTLVDFDVANPGRNESGTQCGILLMQAGFTYR